MLSKRVKVEYKNAWLSRLAVGKQLCLTHTHTHFRLFHKRSQGRKLPHFKSILKTYFLQSTYNTQPLPSLLLMMFKKNDRKILKNVNIQGIYCSLPNLPKEESHTVTSMQTLSCCTSLTTATK